MGRLERALPLLMAFVGLSILLWAAPAEAQGFQHVLMSKLKSILTMTIASYLLCLFLFIFFFARLLGLDGGAVSALLALMLGLVLSVAAAIPFAFIAWLLPQIVIYLLGTAIGFVCGGFAIKWLFSTDLGHGVLVHVLASTASLAVMSVVLILVF